MNTRLLDRLWARNDPWEWAVAGLTGLVVLLVAMIVRRVVRQHYKKLAETERVELMEVPLEIASKTSSLFLTGLALFAGMSTLTVPPAVRAGALKVLTVVFGTKQALSAISFRAQKRSTGRSAPIVWLTADR